MLAIVYLMQELMQEDHMTVFSTHFPCIVLPRYLNNDLLQPAACSS